MVVAAQPPRIIAALSALHRTPPLNPPEPPFSLSLQSRVLALFLLLLVLDGMYAETLARYPFVRPSAVPFRTP